MESQSCCKLTSAVGNIGERHHLSRQFRAELPLHCVGSQGAAADAYALSSIAVDFRIAEVVDAVQVVYGAIPKKIFKTNPDYWMRK